MREIKFRAWLLKERQIVIVDGLNYNKGYGGALEVFVDNPLFDVTKDIWEGEDRMLDTYINHSMDVHKERNNGDDFILMQYTGLKDKNGKEIYEGDIVRIPANDDWDKINYSCFEVFFHDGDANSDYNIGYSINRMHNHGSVCGGHIPAFKPTVVSKMEIIGNIYENSTLIK